jgi:hypothetical protein
MKYQKPEVLQIGAAICAIQASFAKQGSLDPDGDPRPTDSAYESSE